MKLQDCFVRQNVGVNSKSMGVITGTVLELFESKDVDTELPIQYAIVDIEHLNHTLEIQVSKLLGVVL